MKRILILFFLLCPFLLSAQSGLKPKKYPSLLWEITGNGISKKSYLFGTMHVSNKLAFHLADSFYIGIRNADVVALETNPESWQEDMSKYDTEDEDYSRFRNARMRAGGYTSMPNEYLTAATLRFHKYDKKIERSLYSSPSTINNLLYRSYGNAASDFEEDTYLDMYIYQCGKKWGKKVAGVERYAESMRLMAEAYRDASRDKSKRMRSGDREEGFSPDKLQEAYRTGNLDLLDSINKYNSFSAAFDEKFLYKRNEIQANSIDSILKSNVSLFVGVGAAHLPGNRGVIEMLRNMGYKLRPIIMGERDSQHKNSVETLRVPVTFQTQAADDGLFKVDIPGSFYKFGDDPSLDQRQYADMANGSYYMVTRIMTNAWMWGHHGNDVVKMVDSLLYENVPGKIINKSSISKNGFEGFAITNKTRRGDIQRYNIFITPFEVIFFKMSGTGEYVLNGDEADRFFKSIQFKEYNAGHSKRKFQPSFGGFAAEFPHEPYVGNDGSWIFDAEDRESKTRFRIIRTDIHNYGFVEEDSFDLNLMEESFASSEFIDKQLSRKHGKYRGYPLLDAKYLDKTGQVFLARFIIQGPHYYTLLVHGAKETPRFMGFMNSFEIRPFEYGLSKQNVDTSLYYSVHSPVYPESKKNKLDIPRFNSFSEEDEDESEAAQLERGAYRSKIIANDSTGEKIYVSFYKTMRYYTATDSSANDDEVNTRLGDTSQIVRLNRIYYRPDKFRVTERKISDSGSSRVIWSKAFFREGIGYSLVTLTDTLTEPSSFVKSFFDSFVPVDSLRGSNPYAKKSPLFFADFMSADTVAHKRAVAGVYHVKMDSTDFVPLKKAIAHVNWNEKKYLDVKKSLIEKLDDIKTRAASDYLKDLYYAAGDTVELQYTILEALLRQQTDYSFHIFRSIITEEPPVLNVESGNNYNNYYSSDYRRYSSVNGYSNGVFLDDLVDSLELTRTILPDLLPLLNLDDYEQPMMRLLGRMIDSNLVLSTDYAMYFSKFQLEAKQVLKKQTIAEMKKAIRKAENEKDDRTSPYANSDDRDNGNEKLSLYATLLLPFADSKPQVKPLIAQMLASSDRKLKYKTMMTLLRRNQPVPDTLLSYFSKLDNYRYQLYQDLRALNKASLFPAKYNNHLDLATSKLISEKTYDKPDSVRFINKLSATIDGKKGYVYFFKYKEKKDDPSWKLASVGLIPEDPKKFEFEVRSKPEPRDYYRSYTMGDDYKLDLTAYDDTRINEEEAIQVQLNKALKRLMYSKRKSAREFYDREGRNRYELINRVDFGD